jgi:hypothetical protein
MSTLSEETLALRVDEASMQDWLAAVTTFKFAPPSTYSTARFEPHPEPARPLPQRRVASNPVRRQQEPAQATLAGARTGFWVVLAAAAGLMALL